VSDFSLETLMNNWYVYLKKPSSVMCKISFFPFSLHDELFPLHWSAPSIWNPNETFLILKTHIHKTSIAPQTPAATSLFLYFVWKACPYQQSPVSLFFLTYSLSWSTPPNCSC
jgi:hypothetical protein